jgi:hypothetical protein
MVDYGGTPAPTLTVTGNGLTFSGSSSEVYVVIAPSATDVTFRNLSLSGAYSGDGVLVTSETAVGLTINISGTCVIRNTQDDEQVSRQERPVLLKGSGTGASLTVSGDYGFYCLNTFSVDSLEIEIDTINTAFRDGDGIIGEWRFANSTISINSGDAPVDILSGIKLNNSSFTAAGDSDLICSYFSISGASNVDLTASAENASALQTGDLSFEDFTGTFSANSIHSTGMAIKAFGGIKFVEGGTEVGTDGYDLGGTVISSFVDSASGATYSSFGIDSGGALVPAPSATITKAGAGG